MALRSDSLTNIPVRNLKSTGKMGKNALFRIYNKDLKAGGIQVEETPGVS